jgi:hypothetical protein
MASTLAITIPLLGLFIGVHLRQSAPRIAGNIVVGMFIPLSVGAALVAVSMLRNTYISSQMASSTGVVGDQQQLAYALFALNALVFCGAVVSAFFAHDPDEKLNQCRSSLMRLDRRRNAIRKKLYRIGTKINGEIKKAKSRIEQTRAATNQNVALYRQTNLRFRRLLPPPTFRKTPEFPKLEWWPEVAVDGIRDQREGG